MKRAACQLVVEAGIHDHWRAGRLVKMLTITDTVSGSMTTEDFRRCWRRLSLYLRRDYQALDAYAMALEVQERGALHAHILHTSEGRIDNRPKMKNGVVVEDSDLSRLLARCGFGPVGDIRLVRKNAKKLAAYTAKEMAGYVTKQKLEAVEEKFGKNLRPLRLSQPQRSPWSTRFPSLEAGRKELIRQMREKREEEGEEWIKDDGPWLLAMPDGEGGWKWKKDDEDGADTDELAERRRATRRFLDGAERRRSAA